MDILKIFHLIYFIADLLQQSAATFIT